MFTNGYKISIIQLSKWLNSHINSFTGQDIGNTKKDQTWPHWCTGKCLTISSWEEEKHLITAFTNSYEVNYSHYGKFQATRNLTTGSQNSWNFNNPLSQAVISQLQHTLYGPHPQLAHNLFMRTYFREQKRMGKIEIKFK